MVGQDNINRFDKSKRRKKRKTSPNERAAQPQNPNGDKQRRDNQRRRPQQGPQQPEQKREQKQRPQRRQKDPYKNNPRN